MFTNMHWRGQTTCITSHTRATLNEKPANKITLDVNYKYSMLRVQVWPSATKIRACLRPGLRVRIPYLWSDPVRIFRNVAFFLTEYIKVQIWLCKLRFKIYWPKKCIFFNIRIWSISTRIHNPSAPIQGLPYFFL